MGSLINRSRACMAAAVFTGWHGIGGDWSATDTGCHGNCPGNGFFVSTKAVDRSAPFSFEADMKFTDGGNAAGIVFGIKNPENPLAKWYCINVVNGGGISMIFTETDSRADWIDNKQLEPAEKSAGSYHLKVERKLKDGPFSFYVNGRLIHTKEMPYFKGGYFGVMTCGAQADFANVECSINGSPESFNTNLTGWKSMEGPWQVTANGYQPPSETESWALCDQNIEADASFIYEGDILMPAESSGGLVFGAQTAGSAQKPNRWVQFGVEKGATATVTAHSEAGVDWTLSRPLTDAEKKTGHYRLRVECLEKHTARFLLNENMVGSKELAVSAGGMFGITATGSNVCIDNVNYFPASMPKLKKLEIGGAKLDRAFDPVVPVYWSTVGYKIKSVKIKAVANYTSSLMINASEPVGGKPVEVALSEGYNTIRVKACDKGSDLVKQYTINLIRKPNPATIYKETARPQFHFTPFMYQMNDPNGLVYNEATGEYHLFFQCNRPFDTGLPDVTGTTAWGHAVSRDMMNWEEWPLAILPDKNGMAWSGSCVTDRNNSSGQFDSSTPAGARMVAFWASVSGDSTYGYAKESMAYSKDGGRTWISHPSNPVVKNPGSIYGGGLRDPKVNWYVDKSMPNGGIWMMVTVGGTHIFTSHNLIDWTHCGAMKDVNGGSFDSECPDLFPLAVDGDPNNIKWVFTGSGVFYLIGHMEKTGEDKLMFVPETEKIVPLEGFADLVPGMPLPETYATQTFYNDPKGRRVSISWIRDPLMGWKDKNWNSAQSLPLENKLRTINGKVTLVKYPVAEVNKMRNGRPILSLRHQAVDAGSSNPLQGICASVADIDAVITLGTATELGFKLRVGEAAGGQQLLVRYDRKQGKLFVDKLKSGAGWVGVYEAAMLPMPGDKIKLQMLLDQICFDVFGNEGAVSILGLIYSEFENNGMEFFTNGTATIDSLDVFKMKSMKRSASKL